MTHWYQCLFPTLLLNNFIGLGNGSPIDRIVAGLSLHYCSFWAWQSLLPRSTQWRSKGSYIIPYGVAYNCWKDLGCLTVTEMQFLWKWSTWKMAPFPSPWHSPHTALIPIPACTWYLLHGYPTSSTSGWVAHWEMEPLNGYRNRISWGKKREVMTLSGSDDSSPFSGGGVGSSSRS